MHACARTCICAHTHCTHIFAHAYTCTRICSHTWTQARAHVHRHDVCAPCYRVCAHANAGTLHACAHTHACACTCTRTSELPGSGSNSPAPRQSPGPSRHPWSLGGVQRTQTTCFPNPRHLATPVPPGQGGGPGGRGGNKAEVEPRCLRNGSLNHPEQYFPCGAVPSWTSRTRPRWPQALPRGGQPAGASEAGPLGLLDRETGGQTRGSSAHLGSLHPSGWAPGVHGHGLRLRGRSPGFSSGSGGLRGREVGRSPGTPRGPRPSRPGGNLTVCALGCKAQPQPQKLGLRCQSGKMHEEDQRWGGGAHWGRGREVWGGASCPQPLPSSSEVCDQWQRGPCAPWAEGQR